MRKNNRTGKGLRLIPLILGSYAVFLGLGLITMGLAEIKEGIGIIRLLIGLGMAGFGLLGIWDGVRDLIRPGKKAETSPARQFILTDTSGIKSSNVTPELLRKQMDILVESEHPKRFVIQILPPLSAGEYGQLKQISCIYCGNIILAAFFEMPKDGCRTFQKSTEPDMAVEWLKQLLAGSPDFSGWENIETDAGREEEDIYGKKRKGRQITYWHKLLVVCGESWHDEHKFFSARDVELAIEGIYEGKYQKAVLELGTQAVNLFRGIQNDIMVIWCIDNTEKGNIRFLAREGTVTQVKFWLVHYMDEGYFEATDGWADITSQIEEQKGKGKKKHGKIF